MTLQASVRRSGGACFQSRVRVERFFSVAPVCFFAARRTCNLIRRRVTGAWWPPRSSKPVPVRLPDRGRFDSYPLRLVHRLLNPLGFVAFKNGSSARREEGAYLDRYVTDEQRSSRPIFNATLRAAAGWLFFRVARSLRIDLDMLVAHALKNSQLTCGDVIIICETVH